MQKIVINYNQKFKELTYACVLELMIGTKKVGSAKLSTIDEYVQTNIQLRVSL